MARNWRDVRADSMRRGQITESGVRRAQRANRDATRAYRLAQLRKRSGVVQKDVAATLGVSQAAVSKLERGDLSHTQIATLQSYVEALGGELRVLAEFGDEALVLAGPPVAGSDVGGVGEPK